ncbi:MAG: hypothetical protein EOM87_08430, partial [Clostridia bacterium]|nr:hypothetical protein [Clostridia bacterium]
MSYRDDIKRTVTMYQLPEVFTDASLREFISESGSLRSIWGFCERDISDINLTNISNDVLFSIAFNSNTIWGITDYPYNAVFEQMKNPGLGLKKLHADGIDGRGVNIAVIDKPILRTHSEFSASLKEYSVVCEHERNDDYHFHGMTCASFACGKTAGIAPGAKLYYYAYPDWFTSDGMYWDYYFKAFDMIIEHNRKFKDKINIVSVSAGVPAAKTELLEKLFGYCSQMAENGCYMVLSNNFGKTFTCSSRTYGMDVDSFDCYRLDGWQKNPWDRERILIPSGGRTSACNSGNDEFIYLGNSSCYSWAI